MNNEVYVALDKNEIIGFYALTTGDSKLVLEHMWVTPPHIRMGVGRELFNHAVRQAGSLNASAIEIEADPYAEGFYERLGAQRIGEAAADVDGQQRRLPRLVYYK